MLIGSYCMEYAIESAAIFNPSIVEDFDQSNLEKGEAWLFLRATGEGHTYHQSFLEGNPWYK
jgi:hypothetical protein